MVTRVTMFMDYLKRYIKIFIAGGAKIPGFSLRSRYAAGRVSGCIALTVCGVG